jgi:lincosamide nucleotidyltransferase A/C/D/E
MLPGEVAAVYLDFEDHCIPLWLVGGWGIDALTERTTRDHHDLDVLVEVTSLERFLQRLDDLGFERRYLWEESRWVHDASWAETGDLPTAFVYGRDDGEQIDAHAFRHEDDGRITALWTAPFELSAGDIGGRGVLAGLPVRCLTADAQRRAHTGYLLPPHQVEDLQQLDEAT